MAKHEFALYAPTLSDQKTEYLTLAQPDLVHQLVHVLRARVGDSVTLFDEREHVRVVVKELGKKQVTVFLEQRQVNKELKPILRVVLGLPKKPALEEIVYAVTELGAQELYLIDSERVSRAWGGQKELERLHAIAVAAAQQSKQFVLPRVYEPKKLINFFELEGALTCAYLCDADAQESLMHAVSAWEKVPESVTLFIGNESDFSPQEKQEIIASGAAATCRLTPTILRSVQAVNVALGIVRSSPLV